MNRRPTPWYLVVGAVAILLLVLVPLEVYLATPAPRNTSGPGGNFTAEFDAHVQHIVFVVLENHAFDNNFGDYCLQLGPDCPTINDGLPSNSCVPLVPTNPGGPCARPFAFTAANLSQRGPLPHDQRAALESWNNGSMNGFFAAEGKWLTPFGYFTASTAPLYWDLAQEYALSDNFYSSLLDYSLPNHWHIVAGQAPQQIIANGTNLGGVVTPAADHRYLDEANGTTSIEDLLGATSVSWEYYDYALSNYSSAIQFPTQVIGDATGAGSAYNFWNPEAAKAESYSERFVQHFVPNTQFYGDARNGTLPSLSWVIPAGQDSDHPPANSSTAQSYVASLVDALEASPEWDSSLMYITWDDYGGFYDHVDPPVADGGQQLGFRVGLLAVGPYVRADYISSGFGYFESILHLMEWRFGLGCITVLDCNAPLPLDSLNFSGPARTPMLFPTNFTAMSYPFVPLGFARPLGAYTPPSQFVSFPRGELPDVD